MSKTLLHIDHQIWCGWRKKKNIRIKYTPHPVSETRSQSKVEHKEGEVPFLKGELKLKRGWKRLIKKCWIQRRDLVNGAASSREDSVTLKALESLPANCHKGMNIVSLFQHKEIYCDKHNVINCLGPLSEAKYDFKSTFTHFNHSFLLLSCGYISKYFQFCFSTHNVG